METIALFFNHFVELTLEASPWLCLGLVIAGLMKTWLPTDLLTKHLGHGKLAIVKAAIIGAPLPLCSCGVIPVATQLRRSGASNEATSSFLVATPETGVDSVTVSYAMLGPLVAIYRPIAAISSAILTGFLVTTADKRAPQKKTKTKPATSCCASKKLTDTKSCAETKAETAAPIPEKKTSCCSSKQNTSKAPIALNKTVTGFHYAFTKLVDDIAKWLAIGLLFAATVKTFIPTDFLTQYGSGLPAMLLMIALSIPMYICATASTPIAAGFMMAGVSPGTALVFMMAGPATNISTLGVIKNEMGSSVLSRYLIGVAVSAIGFGLMLDFGLELMSISIADQMHHSHEIVAPWISWSTALLLGFCAIKPLRAKIIPNKVI